MDVSTAARHHMIDGQLAPNAVSDERVVAAMGISPRERFVPDAYKGCAYVDDNIPLGHDRYVMQPQTLGLLLQAAQLEPGVKALLIGGATGYSALVMSHLGADVTVIEELRELADQARLILSELGQKNIEIKTSALHLGCPGSAPYDVILINGAVEEVPEEILEQLSENGRLVTVRNVACRPSETIGLGRGIIVRRSGEQFVEQTLFDASVPLIQAFKKEQGFEF